MTKFDVTFNVQFTHTATSILDLAEAVNAAPFTVHAYVLDDGGVSLVCRGVESEGLMALPEAMRKAQVGISHALKESSPEFAGRGLLWGDITAANVVVVE